VFHVNFSEIVDGYALFSLSVALLNSLKANFWVTLEVDDSSDWAFSHEFFGQLVVDLILSFVEISLLVHDFSEDMSIG